MSLSQSKSVKAKNWSKITLDRSWTFSIRFQEHRIPKKLDSDPILDCFADEIIFWLLENASGQRIPVGRS